MFGDVFEDNQDCAFADRSYNHGTELCDIEGEDCRVCINGSWADKSKLTEEI
jgi:hypothetical protein